MGGKSGQRGAERRLAQIAERQHRVVSTGQLLEIGFTERVIGRRVAAGWLMRVHRGVYAIGPGALTHEGRWLAAVLACGAGAVLSHHSAASLWAIRPPANVWPAVTVPRSGRNPRRGIVLHRSQDLLSEETTAHRRIPITTPARTLLDIAPQLTARKLERAVREAQYLRLITPGDIESVLSAHPRYAGRRALAEIARRLDAAAGIPKTVLEDLFLTLCREHRLPTPEVNAEVAGYEVDFLWRRERLIVEADGRDSHATLAAFSKDRIRDERLAAKGFQVLRLTYGQITADPHGAAATIRLLLSQRALLPFPAA